ncbi:DsbA family protein, partial [Salipiger sp. HF18]|uniref:DsbA family protein n=1 Tax=Salipiger sp. HF18 TaxID=2721557 RepID=UPI00158D0FC6
RGLEAAASLARMPDPEIPRRIQEPRELATRLQINGTPSFVFESEMLRGYVPLDGMRDLVAQIRAEG